jgi:Flp pilus assembly pilin Flp
LKLKKNNDGVAAVEFALIAPVFIFMLVGMVDFGVYMNAQMKLENLAYAAATYVKMKGDDDALEENVLVQSGLGIGVDDGGGYTGDYSWVMDTVYECAGNVITTEDDDCGDGDYRRKFYEFEITKVHTPFIPYKGLDSSITLTGYARLQMP